MLIKKLFDPYSPVGGLEISDLAIRFLLLEGSKVRQSAVPLPPGVISRGQILDRPKLLIALRKLHLQIQSPKKMIPVVLVMPAENVYIESFTMPFVPEESIKQTAELNLKMLAPSDVKLLYQGYEIIGQTQEGQIEALAAFANSQMVDGYLKILQEANFGVLSVEFPALALGRLIKDYVAGLEPERPYLVIHLGSDGPDLLIIKNGNIYFNYFYSWASIQEEIGGRQLSAGDIKEFLSRQIKKVINYHSGRSGKPFNQVLLVNSPISQELIKMLKENFSLEVQLLTVGKYNQVVPFWYSVLGAAVRGLELGRNISAINLAPSGLEKSYQRDAYLNFIKYWRNAIAGILGFTLIAFLVADSYLVRSSAAISEKSLDQSLVPLEEVKSLQDSVKKFNRGVDLALKAQAMSPDWSLLLEKVKALASQKVTIERFFVDENLSALIIGRAISDSAVISFKNSFEKEVNFKDVVLPLSNITVNKDGTVSFTLQFKINSLKF